MLCDDLEGWDGDPRGRGMYLYIWLICIVVWQKMEKEMATHSSVLAWRIPGTGEPDGLPSMGLHRVGHD